MIASPWAAGLVAPTVVAAAVSAIALVLRELIARRGEPARLRQNRLEIEGDLAMRSQEVLLQQIEALWRENASVKAREAQSRAQCQVLETQCAELERRCIELEGHLADVRRRLDAHDSRRSAPTPAPE